MTMRGKELVEVLITQPYTFKVNRLYPKVWFMCPQAWYTYPKPWDMYTRLGDGCE